MEKCVFSSKNTPFFLGDRSHSKFVEHPRRVCGRLKDKKLYSCRLTRNETPENSIYVLDLEGREGIQIEFSLLEQVDGSYDTFRGIGLLADG
ncbi:hypothetical protein F5B19DRAFT_480402 [Rostrohypoxylon terebratum]|nr:hypothetical protein F5B19DRAFT_480402 [Rostrohypoxylon terebratum]